MAYHVSRRYFFFGSLFAGAVPAAGFGSVASLRALGYKPYYDKLNVAAVGCGGQGGSILNQASATENIVALCDVDEKRAAANFQKFDKAPKYKDFRVMLDKEGKNIDACTIGIPDHMHATVALHAMQRGKHVYVEKPLTRTPWEARLLQDAAVKYKVATQMGNQGYSHESIRTAAEIIWSGAIGDVKEVHVSSTPGTHPTGLKQAPPEKSVPSNLNYDLWLGGASMRAYAEEYTPYNWRGFFDFGTGQIGNWGIHSMGPVNLALQLGAPTSVEMIQVSNSSKLTFPDRAVIKFEFPQRGGMPPVAIYWHDSAQAGDAEAYKVPGMENEKVLPPSDNLGDKGRGRVRTGGPGGGGFSGPPSGFGGKKGGPAGRPRQGAGGPGVNVYGPERVPEQPGVLSGNGAVFVGTKGLMATVNRGEGVHLLPASRWKEYVLPPQLLTRSPGHMADWVRACKGGEPSCSNFSISGPYAEWMLLGVIAFRVPGKLQWDSKNLRFTNSVEANKYLKPVFRAGWELKL
ncbi:MAG: Gfo/Idh/MocA family oxidoreductase [Acidobacteria bacterium]|nr:Gfo/Idh/MocA family oxidoreductase [Acidobacteriota bacterium]